jgi:hypothetical protein
MSGVVMSEIPQGNFPRQIIEETEEDLNTFVTVLEDLDGVDVIPLKLRHSKMLGGGFHCITATLDIHRKGTLQRYFD